MQFIVSRAENWVIVREHVVVSPLLGPEREPNRKKVIEGARDNVMRWMINELIGDEIEVARKIGVGGENWDEKT